jgi:peptidoglycan/LPS O-acetylase OafA/YrhL
MYNYNNKADRSSSLDLIRIIAALTVFIPHYILIQNNDYIIYNNYLKIIPIIGVEIFFCLSGFLICSQALNIISNDNYIKKNFFIYIIRRIIRTWPLYFFGLFCYILYYKYYTSDTLYYFLFLQNMFQPIVSDQFFSASWSIVVEEFFYIIFPVIFISFYFLIKSNMNIYNKKILILLSCVFIIILFTTIRFIADLNLDNWGKEVRRVGMFRLDSIAFGGLAAYIYPYIKDKKLFTITFFIIFFVSLFFIFDILNNYLLIKKFYNNFFGSNLIFFLFMLCGASLIYIFKANFELFNLKIKKNISIISDLSYPLYIFHILIIDISKNVFSYNLWLNFIFTSFILMLFCFIMRKYIEMPILLNRPRFIK